MKKIILLSSLFCFSLGIYAQSKEAKAEDVGRIALNTYIPDQIEGLPPVAKANLENKLSQIAAKNGMSGSTINPRFIITVNVAVLTKDITATAPPMHAYTLNVTLYIGDGIEGTKFSSESVTLKGVGETETKAYMAALKNLKADDPKYQAFIEKGKNKIIEYYNSKCDFLLKEAQTLASQNKFDEAILKLVSVPEISKDCYTKSMAAVGPIYKKKIDRDCTVKLNQAAGIWSANQDVNTANAAGEILTTVDPEAACFGDVKALSAKMAARVKEINKQEWQFKLKEQQQESERIKAIRDIGVAYGNGQPKTVSYNILGWY